jgi:hypothetical protein
MTILYIYILYYILTKLLSLNTLGILYELRGFLLLQNVWYCRQLMNFLQTSNSELIKTLDVISIEGLAVTLWFPPFVENQ